MFSKKKFVCVVLILGLMLSLFSSCKQDQSNPGQSATVEPTPVRELTEEEKKMKEYFEKSIINEGDFSRIAKVMKKAKDGAPITIGAIGGSITAGANASDFGKTSYGPLVRDWWESKFPGTTFIFVNAGVGATNSVYGAHRVQNDLLSKNPDFVMVEFCVNDNGAANIDESYEGLIRQILNSSNKPGVIALSMMGSKGDNCQDRHLPICQNYGIPMVSYRDALWPEIKAGNMTWQDLSNDDVHPMDIGHKYASGLIIGMLERIYSQLDSIQEPNYDLPAPVTENGFEKAEIVSAASLKLISQGNWKKVGTSYECSEKGDPLILEVDCGYLYVNYMAYNDKTGGRASVRIDDGRKYNLSADFDGGWGNYLKIDTLLRADAPGKHTLTFNYTDTRKGRKIRIDNFMISNME